MSSALSVELSKTKGMIREIVEAEGLDFYPVVFEMVNYDQMNHIAAYGGLPTRYPHWRWGMEYDRLSKSHRYGLSKIYELVINTNPVYAYLLSANSLLDHKLVMAHVFAHADFFKNNVWFSHTNRKMLDQAANHAARVRRYIRDHGLEKVEAFIDACLSLEDLTDPHSLFVQRRSNKNRGPRISSPTDPERDILLFLIEHAPLEPWQRDILTIIRDEVYYFAPQAMTKIMNEGWASYWHSKLMTERLLTDAEVIDYADSHSGTVLMQPGTLNPYKIGLELFRDIEDRWNRGRFGKEYEECDRFDQKIHWDTRAGLGKEKILEVRRTHNDVTFIDTFLTEEFCRDQKMFVFCNEGEDGKPEIQSREFKKVKEQLLFMLTNSGKPFIYLQDGNFANRGELCLWHRHEGRDIRKDYAEATLKNLSLLWGRPAHLETQFEDKPYRISVESGEITTEAISPEI